MARTPINELTEGQSVSQAFRVADKQLRVNRQGGKYILMKLADRTATMAAMLWNADEVIFDAFDRGDYVSCQGRTQVHNGVLQIIVTRIDRMDPAEVDAADFDRFDLAKSDALAWRLTEMLHSIAPGPLRQIADAYLADLSLINALKRGAAAVNQHHAYPGGLLRHTVDLMELVIVIAPRYPQLNRDLLLLGAFLHDLGKIEELSDGGEISYTDRGQLVGHIVIGIQQLGEKIAAQEAFGLPAIPDTIRLLLEHLIVSHHGQLEFGSPKLPVTLEAMVLHQLDNLDAKLASFTAIIENDVAADGHWTNYHPSIGRKLWKG